MLPFLRVVQVAAPVVPCCGVRNLRPVGILPVWAARVVYRRLIESPAGLQRCKPFLFHEIHDSLFDCFDRVQPPNLARIGVVNRQYLFTFCAHGSPLAVGGKIRIHLVKG